MSSLIQEPEQAEIVPAVTTTTTAADTDNNDTSSGTSSPTSTEDKPKRDTKPKYTLTMKLLHLCKEILIMIFVAFAYAALTNENPPKVSKSPAAYPFFSENSLVTDWYKGQVTKAIEQARASDIAFVMFYAPWDAASQYTRKEFDLTAHQMNKYVNFVAVNCWQPGSECKSQYSKVYRWPVLIAYPTHGRGIQYNGPLESTHMIKFLQAICRPLVRPQDVYDLVKRHDVLAIVDGSFIKAIVLPPSGGQQILAVVYANLNTLPGSTDFAVFYLAALRFLEKDPFREVSFAVSPQTQQLSPALTLYLWNETLSYSDEWTPEGIINWILRNLRHVTAWSSPTGTKSLVLSSYIQPGPALILFTPKNPLQEQNDYYSMLKEIGYEYYNCTKDKMLTLKQRMVRMERLRYRLYQRQLKKKCLKESPKNVLTHVPTIWKNTTVQKCEKCELCSEKCLTATTTTTICPQSSSTSSSTEKTVPIKTSMLSDKSDPRSPINLQRLQQYETCHNYFMAQKYQTEYFDKLDEFNFNISGFACKTNKSLALIAMDSLRYFHYAERLGVNLFKNKDKSAAVIINDEMETHYVMDEPVNSLNLRYFISNFTLNNLNRALNSITSITSNNTHSYSKQHCLNRTKEFCVSELNSKNFLTTIMKPNKAILVFYYSRQCAFCSGIAFVYLKAKRILETNDDIEFYRVDGDLNSLPWEYTMESYPTILYFPPIRKSESRAFPRNIPITVPNLLGFILTNLEPRLKLQAMFAICNQQYTFDDDKIVCLTAMRVETLSVIEQTLKEWRNVNVRQKAEILHKLQLLRQLHLLLAHSPNNSDEISKQLKRINVAFNRKKTNSKTKQN